MAGAAKPVARLREEPHRPRLIRPRPRIDVAVPRCAACDRAVGCTLRLRDAKSARSGSWPQGGTPCDRTCCCRRQGAAQYGANNWLCTFWSMGGPAVLPSPREPVGRCCPAGRLPLHCGYGRAVECPHSCLGPGALKSFPSSPVPSVIGELENGRMVKSGQRPAGRPPGRGGVG